MTDPTPRDRALAGEVVKVTDERLERMRRVAKCDGDTYIFAALTELIAARKEIERLKAECDEAACRYVALRATLNMCSAYEDRRLTARIAELEKERDAYAEDARAMQKRLQRAVEGATKMREALERIANHEIPMGVSKPMPTVAHAECCYIAYAALNAEQTGD